VIAVAEEGDAPGEAVVVDEIDETSEVVEEVEVDEPIVAF